MQPRQYPEEDSYSERDGQTAKTMEIIDTYKV